MALPPKSLGTGRHVMAAPILDQGGRGLTNVPILFTLQALKLVGPSRQWGFVTLSAFSYGECSGQQASCGGGCRGPSAE